ncbi:MAG: hypothetical protein PHW86_07320, partial [Candidatus Bipolaricaulis sp.]|nr:hypothetical protein [Candidatus Bipolaricaulis sp.]
MKPCVLVLDNTLHPKLFSLGRRWAARLPHDVCVDIVHAPSALDLPDIDEYTHLILSGSQASVLRPSTWIRREAELVRMAADAGVRILGSCFGHELLVSSLSGPSYLRRAAKPE